MSAIGWLGILFLACAVAFTVVGLCTYRDGWMSKKELTICLVTAFVFAVGTFVVAPVSLWDRYEVTGVVEEVHPGGLLELSDGRVVEVKDSRVVTLRQGDRVDMMCEMTSVMTRNEACQVDW